MTIINITNKSTLLAFSLNVEDTVEKIIQDISDISYADIIALRFNIQNVSEIEEAKQKLRNSLSYIQKPLMICATGKEDIDKFLLPELAKIVDRQVIISYATLNTYEAIVPVCIEKGHYIVLKTPIDINLAKELNILCTESGLDKNKIIMNTDIGGLGYGYEYGYSIIEKIKIEGEKGDEYLIMPIISEASIESLKTKEGKISDFKRKRTIEISAISGVIAAGANIIVVSFPENLKIAKELI